MKLKILVFLILTGSQFDSNQLTIFKTEAAISELRPTVLRGHVA